MYINVRGSVLSSMFVIGSSYVGSPRSHVICITLSYLFCERDEWPSPKDSESLSFPSLRSLLMWLHFMFDLGRSPLFFTYSLYRHRFYRCLWFISFPSRLILSLQRPISGSMLISHPHYTYHYQFILLHLSPYRYHIHVRHSQVHGSRGPHSHFMLQKNLKL